MQTKIGIIGGSGLYELESLKNARWSSVVSPWGEPSDELYEGEINNIPFVFLPRHGRGHRITPSCINYRANIDALKRSGITALFSISACGSFRVHLPPGHFVLPDQFIDRTVKRESSFFGLGCVAHVSMAHPVSSLLQDWAESALQSAKVGFTRGATYVTMEGPQFSSLAESRLYREVYKADLIGMTNMPEAKLAREAEIPYCSVAMVTDFDSWHPDHGAVDIQVVMKTLSENVTNAKQFIEQLATLVPASMPPCPEGSDKALEYAIVTAPEKRDPTLLKKLDAVAGRVLKG